MTAALTHDPFLHHVTPQSRHLEALASSHGTVPLRALQSSQTAASKLPMAHRKLLTKKRQLQTTVDQCQSDLAVCTPTTDQERLFVQVCKPLSRC